jgi:nucleoside-diphosphate-sugar epimerase
MNILITGHTGFIGRHLTPALIAQHHTIIGISRHLDPTLSDPQLQQIQTPSLDTYSDWHQTLTGIDTIIHLAARAHILQDTATDPTAEFFKINTQATIDLAQAAITAGVKHFIFISSIGAMTTLSNDTLTETSPCNPDTPYGKSKLAAETALIELCQNTPMSWTIIRPTLVYGPGNPGNMERLIKLVNSRLPLPLGSIDNHRSFIYIANLVDALITCLNHPNAHNQTFLLSDGENLSTPALIRHLAHFLNTSALLLPIPPALLQLLGKLTGKSAAVERLLGSLTVSNNKIVTTLNWQPPFTGEQGLAATAKWYKSVNSWK